MTAADELFWALLLYAGFALAVVVELVIDLWPRGRR